MNPRWALLTDKKKKAIPHDFENGSNVTKKASNSFDQERPEFPVPLAHRAIVRPPSPLPPWAIDYDRS
jgi:hypothetical protein